MGKGRHCLKNKGSERYLLVEACILFLVGHHYIFLLCWCCLETGNILILVEWSFCLARVTDVRDENLWGGLSRGRWRLTKKHLHLAVGPPSSACLLMLVVICMPSHAHLSVLGVLSFPPKIFLILLCSNDGSINGPKSIFGWAITIVKMVYPLVFIGKMRVYSILKSLQKRPV